MFDLSKNNFAEFAEAGFTFELELPTGGKTGAFITVRGDQSPAVKTFGRKKYAEMQMQQQQAKRKGKETDMSLEDAEALAVESAVVRVISWKGIAEGGKEIPFTKENATEIFTKHSWIREQIMEQSGDLLNFRPK